MPTSTHLRMPRPLTVLWACLVVALAGTGSARAVEHAAAIPDTAQWAPHLVGTNINVLKLWAIDSANESFGADFLLQFTWQDSSLVGRPGQDLEWSRIWTPRVESVNSRDMTKQSTDYYYLMRRGKGYTYNRYHGTFDAPMDLHRFPFDEQTLTIQLESSDYARSEFRFGYQRTASDTVHDLEKAAVVPALQEVMGEAMRIPDWTVKQARILEIPKRYTMLEDVYSRLELQIVIARKPWFFVWKVFGIMFSMVLMSWFVFFMDPAELGKRLTITVTLFLASVAFAVFMTSLTPRVPYLTLLDYYILMAYLMLVLASAESVVAHVAHVQTEGWVNPAKDAGRTFDRNARIVFPMLYLGLHAVFALMALSL